MRLGTREIESLRALATGCHAVPGRTVTLPVTSQARARHVFAALAPHFEQYGATPDAVSLSVGFANGSVIRVRVTSVGKSE